MTKTHTYTRYTNQEKGRFLRLKIDKCFGASVAAKQSGIHVRAAQRWIKQYEEDPDSIFDGKKHGRKRILNEEHKFQLLSMLILIPLLKLRV